MSDLVKRLKAEVRKQPWSRNPTILTEAANEIEKLKNQIKDNAIMHVREVDNIRKQNYSPKMNYKSMGEGINHFIDTLIDVGPPNLMSQAVKTHESICNSGRECAQTLLKKSDNCNPDDNSEEHF